MNGRIEYPIAPKDVQVGDWADFDDAGRHYHERIVEAYPHYADPYVVTATAWLFYLSQPPEYKLPVFSRLVSDTPKTTLSKPEEVSLADAKPGMWAEFDVPTGEHLPAGHYSGTLNAEDGCSYLYVNTGRPIEAPKWFVRDYDGTLAQGVENLHIYRTKQNVDESKPSAFVTYDTSEEQEKQILESLHRHHEELVGDSVGDAFTIGWLAGHKKALESVSDDESDAMREAGWDTLQWRDTQAAEFEEVARLRGER